MRATIGLKSYLADTVALVVFSTLGGAVIELVIAGLSLEQTFWVRVGAIPIMLLAGRPYGLFRDLVFRGMHVREGQRVRAAIADTIANVTFQVPVYGCLLYANGATFSQVVSAISSVVVLIAFAGRPFGIFLESCRKLFRVQRYQD